ncbi:MAG: TMAO reductase system periplasmic protein TorT [Gallionella sp.]|nr:TMAO reductase system periplasmic protein TorT [Gallionella sp.]
MNSKGFYGYCLLGLLALSMPGLLLAASDIVSFAPVPVQTIYPPLKPNGSADDALATGRVVEEFYPMAVPATRPWRIAYLFPHVKDPYWVDCSYGLMTEARRLGVAVDIMPADGYDDLIGQLRETDRAIAKKYDAIVLSPISQTANNPSISKARALGIPVFEMANDSTSDDLTIKITSSLKAMGVDTTEWVIRDAIKRGLKSINIALLPGPADAGWVMGEVAGTRMAAENAAIKVNIIDIKYGDRDLVGQSQLAEKLIFTHGKKIDYLLGCTGCAPAAILPIRRAGLANKIRIVSYGLTRELIENIRKGEIFAATDVKAVGQARVSLSAAVNHLEGRIKKRPHTILVKLGMVDRSNVNSYDYGTTTSPVGYKPVLSYTPPPPNKAQQ